MTVMLVISILIALGGVGGYFYASSHAGPLGILVSMAALGLGVMLIVVTLMLMLVRRGRHDYVPVQRPDPADDGPAPEWTPEAAADDVPAQEPSGPEKRGTCPKCGAVYEPGQRFCGGCGFDLSTLPKSRRCAGCGFELEDGDTFCPVCGAKFEG